MEAFYFSLALPKIKVTKEKGATKTSRLLRDALFVDPSRT
jgi:hypothetical protein